MNERKFGMLFRICSLTFLMPHHILANCVGAFKRQFNELKYHLKFSCMGESLKTDFLI